jgi:serine protease Do
MKRADTRRVLATLAIASGLMAAPKPLGAQEPFRMFLGGPGSQIGVTVRDTESADTAGQQAQTGAVIDEVRRDGPAEKAGLRRGDIVVEFDGERVRSAQQFSRLVRETASGRTISTTVLRDGRRTSVSVVPSSERRPDVTIDPDPLRELSDGFKDLNFEFRGVGSRGRLGVTIEELTPQLADYFGAKEGVLVTAVTDDSAASRAGLKAGDIIARVGTMSVRTRADLTFALRDIRDDGEVEIGIVRDKKESTLKAKLESAWGTNRSSRSNRSRPA